MEQQKIRIVPEKLHEILGYVPHEGQESLSESLARFRVWICGRRWGKTLSAAIEAMGVLLVPETRVWVVSKTYDLTRKVIREIRKGMVNTMGMKLVKDQQAGPILMEFENGSVVEGKSAEQEDSLVGEGLDLLIFDECAKCKASAWDFSLRPTLTDRKGRALFITTPQGYNWVYDLYKRGKDPGHPGWESFQSPSWNNPHLSKEDIDEAKRTLSEAAFAQEYGAEFTIYSGQVYQEFSEQVHVIPEEELQLDPDWPRYRALDFGYENPFVCLYITTNSDDQVIIYDEYFQKHKTVKQHAGVLNEREKMLDETYEWTVCDPSGASPRATLRENDIYTLAFRTPLLRGLEQVRTLLKVREDGKPGLLISSNCVETIREFNLYSYPDNRTSDEPKKVNDHGVDCVRYFCTYWQQGYLTQSAVKYA